MWKTTEAFSSSSGKIYWTQSLELFRWRISGSMCCFFMLLFFPSSQTVEVAPAPAFQSEGGNVLQREEPLQQKIKKDSAPFTRHSVGDSIKSLPCDLFSEKQTASRVSEDQSHQRRAACVWAKSWHPSESFHHRKIVSCRSGEWLAWRYIDTLMQWMPWTVQ